MTIRTAPELQPEPVRLSPKPKRLVVVLGGYGQVGRRICGLLADEDLEIRVAGRRLGLAEHWSARFNEGSAKARFFPRYADVRVPETLSAAIAGAGLVIVAAPVDEHLRNVAVACLEAGCDYMDLSGSRRAVESLQELSPRIRGEQRLFVTQSGCCPGLPSLITRRLAAEFDLCRSIRLGVAISLKGLTRVEEVYGFVDAAAESHPFRFCWEAWRNRTEIDYGPVPGRRLSVPLELAELHSLTEKFGLGELRAFAATPDWRLDCAFRFAVAGAYRMKWGLGRRMFSRLLLKTAAASKAAPGVCFTVEGWGTKGSQDHHCIIRVSHPDISQFTAAAAVLLVRQYLEGKFQGMSGLNMMGHIMDHRLAFLEMPEMGIAVEAARPLLVEQTMNSTPSGR